MTWQCRNVLVSTHFDCLSYYWQWHYTLLYCYRWLQELYSHLQKMLVAVAKLKKCACFYFGYSMFASKSNEVESRYLLENVTSLQVESSV